MKNFTLKKTLLGALVLSLVVVLSSCLGNNGSHYTSQVQAYLQLNGTVTSNGSDTTIVAGSDSLMITNLRLIHGNSHFILSSDSLGFNPQMLSFDNQTGNAALLGSGHGAGIAGTYEAMHLKISQATDTTANVDADFNDSGHYSMIIEGQYNGSDFTFKTKKNFDSYLSITPSVDVPQQNASYLFIVKANVRSWFMNQNGDGFYNPSDTSNTSAINANIQNSFSITAKQQQ